MFLPVCVLACATVIQRQMFAVGMFQNSKCCSGSHANSPATRLPWTEKREIDRAGESEEQRENAPGSDEKTGGERSYACASLREVGERHVKTVF